MESLGKQQGVSYRGLLKSAQITPLPIQPPRPEAIEMTKDAALAFWHLFGETIATEADTDISEGGK